MSATIFEADCMAIIDIHSGDGDGAEVVMEFNGKHIAVSVFPDHSPQHAIENHLISLIGKACTTEDNDEYDAAIEYIYDIIGDAGKPLFLEVAPHSHHNLADQDIHSLLYPETLDFKFKTIDGKPTVVPINPNEAYAILGHPGGDSDLDFEVDSNLPQYSSTEVRIEKVFGQGMGVVSQVLVNGEHMLCKAQDAGLQSSNLKRELDTLQALRKVDVTSSPLIRVPRLLGYVKHAQSEHIIGLLREWIPSSLLFIKDRLRDIDVSTIPTEKRRKWAAQIRETVTQLHDNGLVWGDGKIHNVIVDEDDNAWLIDFGGGWTEGWVDKELAGTIEGDEQALGNIDKFLGVDKDTVS
ncbi:hypothetical protein F4805DRAFT_238629 [Annulohypoxylon moriforme]|nr:hypothetical protein F4805DRAFT_238629 [Annulohypoxylon moriforme]